MSGQIRDPNALIRIGDAIRVLCGKTCHPGLFCPDIYCREMWEAFGDVERVDAVPVVTGTWKAVTDDGENYKRICTCCGNEAPFDELEGVYLIYPHCPWCGADMWKDGDRHA